MASAVSSKNTAMTPKPPSVELTSPPPSASTPLSVDPIDTNDPVPPSPSKPSVRRSRILPPATPTADPSNRLSTASNPAREAPRPSPQSSFSLLPSPTTPAPSSSPPKKSKAPSFPPPMQARVAMPVPTSSSRSSFHPQFASSLSYAAVRDFAYPSAHPLHYGPSAIPSGLTTPLADLQEAVSSSGSTWFTTTNPDSNGFRRLSDPVTIQSTDSPWGDTAQFRHRLTNQPPPLKFSDGPPWSEDEDLQSPVVVAKPFAHGKKHKSSMPLHTRGLSKNSLALDGGEWDSARRRSTGGGVVESGESYYTTRAGAQDLADGEPGGELYHHQQGNVEYNPAGAGYYDPDYVYSDEEEQVGEDSDYSSRFSRDYQFTIASPAEEMHGKAVALFDFVQENENELPLVEGQVVWVSYRHGMGWLVAEDPKTGESGLVPEEYVCLLRDMHAHAAALTEMNPGTLISDAGTPIDEHHTSHVSTFSTSSQDVLPYTYRHEGQAGQENAGVGSERDRLEQIRREQDRAVEEEAAMERTPKLRSDAFEANGRAREEQDECREEGHELGWELGWERKSEVGDAEKDREEKKQTRIEVSKDLASKEQTSVAPKDKAAMKNQTTKDKMSPKDKAGKDKAGKGKAGKDKAGKGKAGKDKVAAKDKATPAQKAAAPKEQLAVAPKEQLTGSVRELIVVDGKEQPAVSPKENSAPKAAIAPKDKTKTSPKEQLASPKSQPAPPTKAQPTAGPLQATPSPKNKRGRLNASSQDGGRG